MIHGSLYSSRSDEWPTPQHFYDTLDAEFRFTLDPCATLHNAKCSLYFTREQNGLEQDWGRHRVFCNPPYGKTMRLWAQKCYQASLAGATVVLLAHARTDTRWFHDWVYGKATEIRLIKGRLKFGDGSQSAPFPSLVAIFKPPVRAVKTVLPAGPCNSTAPPDRVMRQDASGRGNRLRVS